MLFSYLTISPCLRDTPLSNQPAVSRAENDSDSDIRTHRSTLSLRKSKGLASWTAVLSPLVRSTRPLNRHLSSLSVLVGKL